MMNDYAAERMIDALARKRIKEMIEAGKDNDEAHRVILDKYVPLVRSLGMSKISFMVTIGRITGKLTDRGNRA